MQSIYTWLGDMFEILCQQYSPKTNFHAQTHTWLLEATAKMLWTLLKFFFASVCCTTKTKSAHKTEDWIQLIHPSYLLAVFSVHILELNDGGCGCDALFLHFLLHFSFVLRAAWYKFVLSLETKPTSIISSINLHFLKCRSITFKRCLWFSSYSNQPFEFKRNVTVLHFRKLKNKTV